MPNKFAIADTHLGHLNIVKFERDDGSPLRPFDTIEEHDETIIGNWNRVVNPEDEVYHLGDAVINRRCLPMLGRLNGKKYLRRGNHDEFRTREYLEYFDEIIGDHVLKKYNAILTHIPVHPDELERWKYNIHGHLHHKRVMKITGYIMMNGGEAITHTEPDERYINVSCEQVNYTPISFDEIFAR